MRKSRRAAAIIVSSFERYVAHAEMAGAGHPDLIEWHQARLAVARERLILHLMGENPHHLKMPPQPEVEY